MWQTKKSLVGDNKTKVIDITLANIFSYHSNPLRLVLIEG